MAATPNVDQVIDQSHNTLRQISDALFGGSSLLVLILSVAAGLLLGKLASTLLRHLSRGVGRRADAATDLAMVNRLRRIETWIILSIAIARVLFVVISLYFWWLFIHPHQRPTALVGASAILIVIVGGVFSPLLRDLAFGTGMMAEHWFGVGDLITIEPFTGIHGVVERITLRSTRIRGLNGEVIWISNQNISGVRIAQKGVWTMAIELFGVSEAAIDDLVERTNQLLPNGPSLLVRPLTIMRSEERADGVWHATAIGETAPGREWLIERQAVNVLKDLDSKNKSPVLLAEPFARFADNDTERQFARAITNAKKTRRKARKLNLKPVAGAKVRTNKSV